MREAGILRIPWRRKLDHVINDASGDDEETHLKIGIDLGRTSSKEVVAQRSGVVVRSMGGGSVKLSTSRIDHEASSAWRRWIVRSGGHGGRRAAIDGTGARNKVKRLASTRLNSPLPAGSGT